MSDGKTKKSEDTDAIAEAVVPTDLLSEAYHASFLAIRSLDEAKSFQDGAVVLEGEYGGIIYLSCPARLVVGDEVDLRRLLADIDSCFADEIQGARVVFRRLAIGSVVAGGGGGGLVIDGLWLHKDVRDLGLESRIRRTLLGEA